MQEGHRALSSRRDPSNVVVVAVGHVNVVGHVDRNSPWNPSKSPCWVTPSTRRGNGVCSL